MGAKMHLYGKPSQEARAAALAKEDEEKQRIVAIGRAPWLGYCPDIPPHLLRYLAGFQSCQGVVARSRGHGECLTQDDGQVFVFQAPTAAKALVGADDFQLTNGDNEPVFIWAYDAGVGTIQVGRLTTALAIVELDPSPSPLGTVPTGDRDVLWDMAAFPPGAPTRNYGASYDGISSPCMVMCGGDENGPTEPVLITPGEAPVTTIDYDLYMELWETTFPAAAGSTAPVYPFKAKSCEAFAGRMHWLNTTEGTVNYPQRLRYSALGTADPSNAQIGSGAFSMREFKRHGLRVETLGNQLACYFGDGVAFVTRTGSPVDPYRYQVISKTRGLLSTHALCAYHANVHFGIFDDGWWKLNSSGQWEPVGVIEVDEGGGRDVLMHKWKQTFYSQLDTSKRHQITTVYDPGNRRILIAWPKIGGSGSVPSNPQMVEVWSYDVDQDRVWPLYPLDVSQWAAVNRTLQAGTLINALTNPIDSYQNKIDEWGSKTGLRAVMHGSSIGAVYSWESSSFNHVAVAGDGYPAFWSPHAFIASEDIEKTTTLSRVGLEFVCYGINAAAFSVEDASDNSGETQTRTIPGNQGTTGRVQYGFAHFHHHAEAHRLTFSTTAPFEVRAMRLQFEMIDGDARTTTEG
jgi:hypothetical protein